MADLLQNLLDWLTGLGHWGIMIGLMLEVIPSEIVLAYGGFLVERGDVSFFAAIVFGTIGGTIAQIFVYWIGRYGGRPFLERFGKYIFISKKHIDLSEQWFNRYGTGIIFSARFIPVVRHAISVPAGMARMPLWKFTFYTTLAVIPWTIFFVYLGMKLGENWKNIKDIAAPYIIPLVIGGVALLTLYFWYKWSQNKRKKNTSNEVGDVASDVEAKQIKNTSNQLELIGDEYRVIHNAIVQAGDGKRTIDHLVIGPNGIFLIETKDWSGEVTFSETGIVRKDAKEAQGETKKEDPIGQLYRHEYIVKEWLRSNKIKVDVVGVLCFDHPNVAVRGESPAFSIVQLDGLLHFVQTKKTTKGLRPDQISQIYTQLSKMQN